MFNVDYKICKNCKGKLIADLEESSSTYGKCLECQVNNCKECWGGNPHQCRYKMIKGLFKEHKDDGNGNGDGNGSHGKGDNKNGRLPLGAIIGIAVGAAVVVIVVVVYVTVFCITKKRKDISTGEAKEEA